MATIILFKRAIQWIKEENEPAVVLSEHTNRQWCLEVVHIVLAELHG